MVARSRLGIALRRARWTIFWERLWPALARLVTVIGLFLTVSWLGLWLWLPPLARAAGLSAFAILALGAIVPFLSLRVPAAVDALRRLDRGSGVRHRPATTIADELAVTSTDPYSLALWRAHVERTLAQARAFRAGWPSPRLSVRDPYALRGLVLIAAIATFIAAGGEHWKRVAAAFDWQGVVLPANFRVDAWVTPPAYTSKPPIILAGMHPGEVARQDADAGEPVSVPAGSTLVVRATGKLNLDISGSGGVTPAAEKVQAPVGTQEYRFKIATTGAATLRGVGDDLTWAFNVIPDKPPTISLAKDPEQQARGSLLLSYRLEDDYGVTEARAAFARKDDPASKGDAARPLFGPPEFALVLPQARTKSGIGQTIKDLTDHPWAGAEVTMTLTARDEAGNEGHSEPVTFRLPERVFTKPLARALVEQRRNLALDAGARPLATTALDALAMAPEKFTPDPGIYLGLRSTFWSLIRAKTDDDLREVTKRLWQMAVGIEDGDISDAQASLRSAEEALRQALERGATDQEIKQLMDQLRAAMDRFLQSMQEQMKNSQQLARPLDRNARTLSQRDLKSMLDRLENMARNGSRDAAKQLLQQLQQMMENLQMASPDQNGDDMDDMMSQLDELGDMIGKQQDLRDRTFRQGQNQRRQNGQRGQQGKRGQGQDQQQDEISERPATKPAGAARPAQEAARRAQEPRPRPERAKPAGPAWRRPERHGPAWSGRRSHGRSRGPAWRWQFRRCRQFPGACARCHAQGRTGPRPIHAAATRTGSRSWAEWPARTAARATHTDPLGRPLRGRDYGDDVTVKVPGEIDVQRARRIIEELRRRFGDGCARRKSSITSNGCSRTIERRSGRRCGSSCRNC